MHSNLHLGILRTEPCYPRINVPDFMRSPGGTPAAAFSKSTMIHKQHIVSQFPVHRNIRKRHSPIMIDSMKNNNRLVQISGCRYVSTCQTRTIRSRYKFRIYKIPHIKPASQSYNQNGQGHSLKKLTHSIAPIYAYF